MGKEIREETCYSNEFIRFSNAFKPLNDFETDLFLFICSKAKENYTNNNWEEEFEIDMADFLNKSNRKKRWSKYNAEEREEIILRIKDLQNKSFQIYLDKYKVVDNLKKNDWEEYMSFSYVSFIHYYRSTKQIKLIMPKKTREFLCNNETNFTPLKLKYLYRLKSKHTKILYMYFRSFIENTDSKIHGSSKNIVGLKELLQLEDKYSRWIDFKRYILLPAIREINKNTDIFITGYREEMQKQLDGRNFKELNEDVQLRILVDSMCVKGSSGKAIKKIQFHVISKESDIYKKYYETEEVKVS